MNYLLDICNGACWSLVYIAAIVVGFRNHTYCIPAVPICLNIMWESLVVLNRLHNGADFTISFCIQILWLLLDIGIIITWQLFRRRDSLAAVKDVCCLICAIVSLSISILSWEISAFVINLIMSVSFVIRLRKEYAHWTSFFIAITKMIGTFAATLLDGILNGNAIVLWLGGLCLFMDVYYALLLRKEAKRVSETK